MAAKRRSQFRSLEQWSGRLSALCRPPSMVVPVPAHLDMVYQNQHRNNSPYGKHKFQDRIKPRMGSNPVSS